MVDSGTVVGVDDGKRNGLWCEKDVGWKSAPSGLSEDKGEVLVGSKPAHRFSSA